ncbi:MAG: UDP-N-acetylmuramate dehydrogenase [Candidatus Kerfeldbacteria bacterium]|nr:UDP-N-acetylmuramate dehydrogenase [Candidatus Kerfeldbacteria bacterium]
MEKNNPQLLTILPGVKEREILAPYTSFKIGGPARYFYSATNNSDFVHAIRTARELRIPYFILGNGSNILVADKGFSGLVIKQDNHQIIYQGTTVIAESGVKLQKLIRDTISHGLTGLEYLMGIPGTIGGGVAGNVGTPRAGEWIDEHLVSVEILDAESHQQTIPKSQCDFSYRFSRFKYTETEIILSATFSLSQAPAAEIQQNVKMFLDKRSHQPIHLPCAGSIFKNPPGHKSWQLVDAIGFRGKQIGGARVADEHSNFIVNTGKATAEDVAILISYIKQQVRDRFGIQLQEEIKYVGFEQ